MEGAKYLIDGTEVEVLSEMSDGRFVIAEYYSGDVNDGPYLGEPKIVDKVFDEPPTKVYDATILAKQAEIQQLETRLRTIRDDLIKVYRDENPTVNQLRALMDGRYTHALLFNDYSFMDIVPIEKLDTDSRDGRHSFVLHGIPKRGFWTWRLMYKESSYEAVLCTSMAEALVAAQQKINELEQLNRMHDHVVQFAMVYGLKVSQKYVDQYRDNKRKVILDRMRSAAQLATTYQESVDKYKEELKSFEEGSNEQS